MGTAYEAGGFEVACCLNGVKFGFGFTSGEVYSVEGRGELKGNYGGEVLWIARHAT
jgi:hypothetical protein